MSGQKECRHWQAGNRPLAGWLARRQACQLTLPWSAVQDTHTKVFIVHADNVGSKQFMDIRAVSF